MSKEVLIAMFDVLDWKDQDTAYIKCPGSHLHTGKNNKKDCRANLDNAPTIFCLHSSCSSVIEDANYKFRRTIWEKSPVVKREFSDEEKKKIKFDLENKRREENIREWAVKHKDSLIKKYHWPAADVFHESPIESEHPEYDARIFLSTMFDMDDVIWIGQPTDSGKPENKNNFKTIRDWLNDGNFNNFTCPSIFKTGSISRSNENVINRKYLVVESDKLSMDDSCSIYRWLNTFIDLKSIVYTGGKSIHGWFKFPSSEMIDRLKICLPAMGCDEALFKPSQPVRLPGILRGEKWQSIYYLKQ